MPEKDSIVFINQNAGYLMIDIINAHQQYNKRCIITGKLISRNTNLDNAVKIENIIAYNRTSPLRRMITWFLGFAQIIWLIKTRYRKSELFIVTNPPFAGLVPLFCNNKFSMLVYDIYPDVLVAYNFFADSSFITKTWRKANRTIFKKANRIFTISNGMKNVLSQYIDKEKIEVVSLWADNRFLKPLEKTDNIFISNNNLQGKFLIIYSGNLGHAHNIEVMVEIASAIKDKYIHFVIIGEGDKKESINTMIQKNKLNNCTLLPWQDVAVLPFSLSSADLAVVTLGKDASGLSIPSKIFSLMSVGAPLICIADLGSELVSMVNQYQIGKCFDPTEVEKMITFIQYVKSNKEYHFELIQNTLKASKNFGPENALKFVEPKVS